MKHLYLHAILAGLALMDASAKLPAQPVLSAASGALGPRISFATNTCNFGRVMAGTIVKYVFHVASTGDQPLEISAVVPGCHCTTAGEWSRHLEPGQSGIIPIQYDSGNMSGEVTKSILIVSNDKLAPQQTLSLHGTIWRTLEFSPPAAYFNVRPDTANNTTVIIHITNNDAEPVTLASPASANNSFKAELKTINPGREFELSVTAVPPLLSGNTSGTISISTSLTNLSVVNIPVFAMVQAAVRVVPEQMILPPQINAWTTNYINIFNNQNKPLMLFNPEICCDARAGVELQTLIAGRNFQLVVALPPGFDIVEGQVACVSVTSDDANYPLITVPLRKYSYRPVNLPSLVHPLRHRVPGQSVPIQPEAGNQ